MNSYSEIVLDHARNPRNAGVLANADARGLLMNPVCGDTLVLMLRIDGGLIVDVRFQTSGCTAAVAASSILTEMVKGLTLAEADELSHEDISEAVGGLPASKLHSAALVIGGLKRTLAAYRDSHHQT